MRLGTEAKKHQKKLIVFTLASLCVHILVFFFVPVQISPKNASEENPLYVELDDALVKKMMDETKRAQVVNTEESLNKNESPDAKFLSEKTQSTAEEMKARNVDEFKSGGKSGGPSRQAITLKSLAPQQNIMPPTPFERSADNLLEQGDYQARQKNPQQAQQQSGGMGGNAQGSSNSDYLKDIKEGDRTVLNTKEFVYFGYYKRIRDRLELAWRSRLRNTLEGYMFSGRQLATSHAYVTRLIVVLDRHGKITAVKLVGDSGLKDLDRAAVDAFNQAGPFPDPPSGLVDENGVINIPWDFILQT